MNEKWVYIHDNSQDHKEFEQGTFVVNNSGTKPHLFFIARVLDGYCEDIWHDLVRLGFKGIVNRESYVLVLFPIFHYDKHLYYSYGSHFLIAKKGEFDGNELETITLEQAKKIAREANDYMVSSFLENDNVVEVLQYIPTKVEEKFRFSSFRYAVLKNLAEKHLVVPLEYHRYFNHKCYGYIHAYEDEHRLDSIIYKHYKLRYKDDKHCAEYALRVAEDVVRDLDSNTLARLKEETYNTNKLTCSLNVAESFYRRFMGEHYKRIA